MGGWMDGWMDGWMNGMNEGVDGLSEFSTATYIVTDTCLLCRIIIIIIIIRQNPTIEPIEPRRGVGISPLQDQGKGADFHKKHRQVTAAIYHTIPPPTQTKREKKRQRPVKDGRIISHQAECV